jgi:hypothetical protein
MAIDSDDDQRNVDNDIMSRPALQGSSSAALHAEREAGDDDGTGIAAKTKDRDGKKKGG